MPAKIIAIRRSGEPQSVERASTDSQAEVKHHYRTQIEHLCNLNITHPYKHGRKTGVICTIGPACRSPEMIHELMVHGMNIARLNFSHGTHEYHAQTIANIKEAIKSSKEPRIIAIALDTKGPEIRTGILTDGLTAEINLAKDATVTITIDEAFKEKCTAEKIFVDYPHIINVLQPKSKIFIDDGLISLVAEEIGTTDIRCTVENAGKLGSRKGVNLPGAVLDLPAVTERDIKDLKFGIEQGIDIIFASFARSAAAIHQIREILGEEGAHIKIIAKIENQEGVDNVDSIIEAADGIMVARGDLGIEIPAEKVFLAQKMIIAKCNRNCKPVICATQMLESMILKPRPTRAEASDVANAVLDGADCVMLSGETAKGLYPIDAILTMHKICKEAESAVFYTKRFEELLGLIPIPTDPAQTVAISVTSAVVSCSATAIICVTKTGRIASLISQWRPMVPLYAVCNDLNVAKHLHLFSGIHPLFYQDVMQQGSDIDLDLRIGYAIAVGKHTGTIKYGDYVVVVSGATEASGITNNMRIMIVP